MAIRNILFIVGISALALFTSCQTIRRSNVPVTPPPVKSSTTVPEVAHPPTNNEPAQVPEFVAQRTPRVGLIFGPGGAKTFAHIGVLQELERYKMPIVAVAGLEWGALVGSLYSLNSQSHEVDWKMSQLPKQSFSSKNLFSNKMKPADPRDYNQYLEKVFSNAKLESAKLPFACPYVRGASGKTGVLKNGVAKAVIKACWYYPPLFAMGNTMAAPFAIADLVEVLRKEGAELIIFIDVLGSADRKDFADWSDEELGWFSWVPVQAAIGNARLSGVHETIKVDTSAYSMFDMDQRLRLIQVGKQGSASTIDRLAKKYDF
jgi:NTE family protein